jgi:hypothetical protein
MERGQVLFDKAVAGIFLLLGAGGLLNAAATMFATALNWWDTGHVRTTRLGDALHLKPHAPHGPVQHAVDILMALPEVAVFGVIALLLVRGGVQRWIDADLRGRPSPERLSK